MMNPKNLLAPALLALLLLAGGKVEAKTPWHWQMYLQTDSVVGAMQMPTSLFIDATKSRYYVADSGNNRLLSFDRDGKLLHSFTANDELKTPYDMIRTESNELWVVEKGRNTLTKIDSREKKTIPQSLQDKGLLIFPDRVEYKNDHFYLLDKASGDILILDRNLLIKQRLACPAEKNSGGFVDFKLVGDEVWSLDQQSKTIYHFRKDGGIADRISLGEEVHSPVSLAIGRLGVLYILDRLDGKIAAFDRAGRFKYSFLSAGQAQGQLYFPKEILFDPWGQLCIVDEGNGRVAIFSR